MDKAHMKAQETRKANEAKRAEAARKAAEELAETVKGLNEIVNSTEATTEEKLEAARLIVELKKAR